MKTTTKSETFTKQVPVALAAIGQHMHDHQLPVPLSINFDADLQTITVRLVGSGVDAHQQWLTTLVVDEESNESIAGFNDLIRSAWSVKLPDLGIRFELVAYRLTPLQAVSA